MHPLTPNLRELSDQDIQTKITELNNRLMFCYQTGNAALIGQIQMLLEDYRAEAQVRQQKLMDQLMEKGGQFKNIIDVKNS